VFFMLAITLGFRLLQTDVLTGENAWLPWLGFLGVLIVAIGVLVGDKLIKQKRLDTITAFYFGMLIGLVLTYVLQVALTPILPTEPEWLVGWLQLAMATVVCYSCISVLLQTKDDFRFIIPYVEFAKEIKGLKPYVLDTSVVIDGRIVPGAHGNAGAFGSIPVSDPTKPGHQLIEHASIYALEEELRADGQDTERLWAKPPDWSGLGDRLDAWIDRTAFGLATAVVSVTAVLDLPDIVIDGSFPPEVRERLVRQVDAEIPKIDLRGVRRPRLHQGSLGRMAGAYGSAHDPLRAQFLRD